MDERLAIEVVNRLFVAADDHNWKAVENSFTEKVTLDYTSMAGGSPAILNPMHIAEAWKALLPGFDRTHHQLGNHIVSVLANEAKVFCYGTATHILKNDSNNNLWTVVGSYDFDLIKIDRTWRISKMKFNLKYLDGNLDLPKLAQERVMMGKSTKLS